MTPETAASPELTPTIVACIIALTGLIGTIAAFFKQKTEILKIKESRAETAEVRNRESQELHDNVIQLKCKYEALQDVVTHQDAQIVETQKQQAIMNTQLAQVLTRMDDMKEILLAIKDSRPPK